VILYYDRALKLDPTINISDVLVTENLPSLEKLREELLKKNQKTSIPEGISVAPSTIPVRVPEEKPLNKSQTKRQSHKPKKKR